MAEIEITLDDRRRTSLARVGRREHRKYLAETFPDGTIVFRPAVTVTTVELAALGNPAVHRGAADAAAGRVVRRPA